MNFNITNQSISTTSHEPLVSGTVGKYRADFSFDASWDGLVATAVFKAATSAGISKVERKVILVDNTCEVPHEVVQEPDRTLWVGVYGIDASGTLIVPTIWCRVGYIADGTPTDASPGQDPTPSIAEQMMAEFSATKQEVQEDADRAEAAADRAENAGGGGGAGKDGLSAYEIAVKNGFTGTEAEWLASLKADGDMLKSIYDPQGLAKDVFAYTDDAFDVLRGSIDFVDNKISAHSLDMRNPHNVSPDQIGAAVKSVSVDATLTATGWTGSGPYTQTVQVPGLGENQNGDISLAHSATAEQREIARSSMLVVSGQALEELTIVADGDRPNIDLPVSVILLG